MEKLTLQNGKEITIDIDYGNGLPYKPLFISKQSYGYYEETPDIAYIKIHFKKEECEELSELKVNFNDLHFIDLHFVDDQFWFDFDIFYLVIHNNDFIYNHIFHKKFTIILNDNNEKEITTLNFIKD